MSGRFDCFVGIDWSGDKRNWQKGLKVAIAYPGRGAPQLVSGPSHNGGWSRTEVVRWIIGRVQNQRVLIGFDFAFGFPPVDNDVVLDWDYVERVCHVSSNFYGGAFFRPPTNLHSHLVNSPWLPRARYSADSLRRTDFEAMKIAGARPQSIFNAVGAAQVGPSSISGMRALRFLRQVCGDRISIWPLDAVTPNYSVIVEIFPRYFCLLNGKSARLVDQTTLNVALASFESDAIEVEPNSEDEGDAKRVVLTSAMLGITLERDAQVSSK
jgi:hypothetical protein